jgi:hypothetical protein
MKDYNKDQRYLFSEDEKRPLPWRKILAVGAIVVIVICGIVWITPEPEPVSVEIQLPKLN